MKSTNTATADTTTVQRREILKALADCAQARKDLDTARNVHYATIRKAVDSGTAAKDLAGQLGVSRSAVYEMAAKGKGLDPELFPLAQDELMTLQFGHEPEELVIPALLGSYIGVDSAKSVLWLLAARARDSMFAEIASAVGCSVDTVRDHLTRHDRDRCHNCGEPNYEHTEREKALCQQHILGPGQPQPPPKETSRGPPMNNRSTQPVEPPA